MPIVYREYKGAPLSVQEIDGNFKHLDERLTALESGPLMAEGIKEIRQEGDQLIIEGTFGRMFGPFVLPKYLPNVRGEWTAGIRYVYGDWVNYKKALYFCKQAHVSSDFEAQADCWQVLVG
ncbi:MAG: hypothetical protein K2Q34_07075 [Alphaproteobacteria bacterium]|nr:hypothetical protein [Alphaproteobacteria bacterium]